MPAAGNHIDDPTNDDICMRCNVRSSPSALEVYGAKEDTRLILRKNEILLEKMPSTGLKSVRLSFNSLHRVNDSFNKMKPIPLNRHRSSNLKIDQSPERNSVKILRLAVEDIIVCEVFPQNIKITSMKNGIFELTNLTILHRELFVSFVSNLLPSERIREYDEEFGGESRPYEAAQTRSICSLDTCDSISLTMDRFTGEKLKQAKNKESYGSYIRRKLAFIGRDFAETFRDCSCSRDVCGNQTGQSPQTMNVASYHPENVFSYEEEIVASPANPRKEALKQNS